MKILIISAQPPSIYSGGEIRLLNLIQNLKSKHEFSVLTPLRLAQKKIFEEAQQTCRIIPVWLPDLTPEHSRLTYQINAWRQALFNSNPRIVTRFASPQISQAVELELTNQQYELIQVQQLHMAQYLPRKQKISGRYFPPSVLDVDNLWTKLTDRPRNDPIDRITHRLQNNLDSRKIPEYEKKSLQRFTALLAVSPEDQQTISKLAPKVETVLIPNGVDCNYFSPYHPARTNPTAPVLDTQSAPRLLFTGTMSYEPNVDAVLHFSREIFPLIRNKYPNAIFQIVGRDPSPSVVSLAKDPNIHVAGFVEDIRPYMADCDVYIVPLRAGAGTRLKILEALAMGKPVVSTTVGADGLQVIDREHILFANRPEDFAASVFQLLTDPELSAQLGSNGRKLVETDYQWPMIAADLDALYHRLFRKPSGIS